MPCFICAKCGRERTTKTDIAESRRQPRCVACGARGPWERVKYLFDDQGEPALQRPAEDISPAPRKRVQGPYVFGP